MASANDLGPSIPELDEPIETLRLYTTLVLFEFAERSTEMRDTIIRNFLARGMVTLEAIIHLARDRNVHDGWILHRSLLDRLFHLRALAEENEFRAFEEWSFYQQAKAILDLRSDAAFGPRFDSAEFTLSPEQQDRYHAMQKSPRQWRRPKAASVARSMELAFLYRYGYDYASRLVHPMANDGLLDFNRLIGIADSSPDSGMRVLASNSCLVQSLLIQEGMTVSTLHWRALMYNFCEHFREFLGERSPRFMETFYKIGKLKETGAPLCRPSDTSMRTA